MFTMQHVQSYTIEYGFILDLIQKFNIRKMHVLKKIP